ncbi:LysM peptidoglycan-binding domain-containing protein [Sphingomonas panacisoli]|uniref:LysM peptidoglycan-binding domain-containing protein n=1 Tax=Sphingomonas panacisoli TaxID=1813879 RepID=A0A5B8LFA2_9SPHN|nr:DUF2235 domain-containing protein [Sphingomonas panacisoli]QDZ06425.1 LysM peptidoglycan-binding domain-containing protein [Sphingomonas panacisoli]
MKRLIFCFDGTWNKLNETTPTNVVLTAASIERVTRTGTTQIIHYDEGVGTGRMEYWTGGMFGAGLVEHVRAAYRFLIFNYDPGDELYIFGFSRGAFSARSFVGFLRHVGPLSRLHAGLIDEALNLYRHRLDKKAGADAALRQFRADYSSGVCIGQADDDWRCANIANYAAGSAPTMAIRYLGVWDTVEALGVPAIAPFSNTLNREHRFHDATLDAFVENARHAVALDERRALFPSLSLGDLSSLNQARGHAPDDEAAPYQERWFPGVHGSVGGGGDIRGLSDEALSWVLGGAKKAGLQLDTARGTRIDGFHPDWLAPLNNVRGPAWSATQLIHRDRAGPQHLWQLSSSAVRRWQAPAAQLPDNKPYRPNSLAAVGNELATLPPWSFSPPDDVIDTIMVKSGDSLSKYAAEYYGDPLKYPLIYSANLDVLDDPNELFAGQMIRIPRDVSARDPGGPSPTTSA